MDRLKHIVQLNILFGAWLIVAPFIMGYSASMVELANDVAVGVVLIACSWWIVAAMTGQVGASVLQLMGGLWLITAPFYFHYERLSSARANDVIVGILATTLSVAATWMLASRLTRRA